MLRSTRLFGDGKHGQAERIQTFRCQACRTTFSARRDTPLYRLKTPSHQVAMVLSALAEGLGPSAAEWVFGYRQATITTWLTRAGQHAQTLHQCFFANLRLPHIPRSPMSLSDREDDENEVEEQRDRRAEIERNWCIYPVHEADRGASGKADCRKAREI